MRILRFCAALALGVPAAHARAQSVPAQSVPAYTIARTVALGSPDRWDYVTYDPARHLVLVAHGDHTDLVDAESGAIIGKLRGLDGAHGQIAAQNGQFYADSGESGTVTVFDGRTLAPVKTIPAAKDADAMAYDPVHNVVLVAEGDAESATLIDAATNTVRATVALGGKPEAPQADGHGLFYVNLASSREVVRLDVASNRVTARYAVADCLSPHGIAVDAATHRVFVSCRNDLLVAIDTRAGREVQSLRIAAGTDSAAFDPVRHLVFSSNGSGSLSVFHEDGTGRLTKLGEVPTAVGARTLALNTASGAVYLVTADLAGPVGQGARPAFKPGSVKLLMLERGR